MGCCGKDQDDDNIEMNAKGDGGGKQGKYGAPRKYDPTFNGPIKNRGCTDIICCILFVLYIVGMVIVGALAFVWGDPMKLINPTDSKGRVCGKDAAVASKPYLFYFDLTECVPSGFDASTAVATITNCPTYTVCVSKCPEKNTAALLAKKDEIICKDDHVPGLWDSMSYSQKKYEIFTNKSCAPYTLQSSDVVSRCIPTVIGTTLSSFLSTNKGSLSEDGSKNITQKDVENGNIAAAILLNLQNLGKKVIQDVQTSWYWILAGLGIAMVASFLYILVMRWVAGILVWLTTYAVLTLIGYGTYYCYNEYDRLKKMDSNQSLQFQFSTNLSSYKDKKETWLAFTIILGVTLGILLLLLLALRSRIRIAIQIIKEASKAISRMISTLFFPIIPWIFQVILFTWFVGVLTYLVTSGDASYKQVKNGTVTTALCKAADALSSVNDQNVSCNFIEYKTNDNLLRMQVFHLFGWFWLMNFIVAFGQCVLAGAFASWYWAWDKKTDVPTLPLLASMGRTLRYHTGSLAFGSLIIAIIQLIRAGLEYLDHKLNGPGTQPGPVTKFLIKCLKCCFWCFEKFIKFLNKNAYIEIAVYGKNFCTSAKNAFLLLMRNVIRVVVLDKVTDFLLFIGKLTVVMGIAVGSFYWFKDRKDLNYYLAPVMIITVGAYMIVSAFFSVYEMSIDTIFLCFLEDSERHDGSPEKPYYMSKSLKKILGKKNKKSDDDDD
ncbi:choline transporter-like protein 4 isoform X2 [Rhopilema esculentum]|uniref:choline transporter-like protein 4 isoform X2 n=1 Tax=Rhopilema esculentum TaxID=499914 RepID=UPI0031D2B744